MCRLFLIAICAIAPIAALHANQTVDMVDGARAEIELIEYLEHAPPSGWIPVALRIVNRAPVAREWTVRFEADVGPGSDLLGEWTVRVPANDTRETPMFVPQPWLVTDSSYFTLRGHVSGPEVANGGIFLDRTYTGGTQTTYTGMSQTLAGENWSRLESELAPASGTGSSHPARSGANVDLVGSRVDPALVPADWRTWSGFATLWLARDDWIGLAGAQRLAILRWVAQGGELYLAGPGGGLEDLPPLHATRTSDGSTWQVGNYGFGTVTRVPYEESATSPRLAIESVANIVGRSQDDSPALARLNSAIATTESEVSLGQIRQRGELLCLMMATIALLIEP
jgi:hypothetical protein